jgi:hypothetical protein
MRRALEIFEAKRLVPKIEETRARLAASPG